MSRVMGIVGAIGIAAVSSVAMASELVEGIVDIIDEENKMIQLVDGQQFKLDATHEFTDLEIGEKVIVTYEEQDGEMIAIDITQNEPND